MSSSRLREPRAGMRRESSIVASPAATSGCCGHALLHRRDLLTRAAMPRELKRRRRPARPVAGSSRARGGSVRVELERDRDVTSPRGAARRPASSTSPRNVFDGEAASSPCATRTRTTCCPSCAVENARVRSHGIFALRGMIVSQNPPTVSTTSARGVTSMSTGGGMLGVNTGARGGWLW